MKMREYCLGERPREKLRERGAAALSNGELIAVLLRTGMKDRNVLEVAQSLLNVTEGRLGGISEMSVETLCRVPGIGPDKAVTLCAAFEIARRWSVEKSGIARRPVRSAEDAYAIMSPRLRNLDHEEFWALFLNRSNYVLGSEALSTGGLSSTSVDAARVVKRCLEKNATGVIVFHNHPSGNPMPGKCDLEATGSLKTAMEAMGLSLLDHIIVGDGSYYSFATETEYFARK